ncbi:hypothetical protein [Maledivibacter halophilus]|uniref:Lipoprotein n=1 Tax=Maledivibacter halophilus TaxID=36842 RepID=A0A1T5MB69_9FIRM|nr:hypothetical protein [Maledivibacter halophilus]SKC85234.1 hypothetical protein SAMN02194393_04346 [Maledivibacter halophilus]
MRSISKKVFCILCILILAVSAVGCKTVDSEEPNVENNEAKEENENSSEKEVYNKDIAKYFPAVEGTVLRYYGTAEYGQTLTLNKVIENEEELRLAFKGEIDDLSDGEGPSKEELILEVEYVIDSDSVKEIYKNQELKHSQSIIREQIVLKSPIEEGKAWNQTVNIDGMEYEAETKIIEIFKDENGKNLVKTETLVKGMENYPEDTYKEVRVYKEDKGLVEFNKVILLEGLEGEEPYPFEFGYRLYEQE